MYSHLMLFTF